MALRPQHPHTILRPHGRPTEGNSRAHVKSPKQAQKRTKNIIKLRIVLSHPTVHIYSTPHVRQSYSSLFGLIQVRVSLCPATMCNLWCRDYVNDPRMVLKCKMLFFKGTITFGTDKPFSWRQNIESTEADLTRLKLSDIWSNDFKSLHRGHKGQSCFSGNLPSHQFSIIGEEARRYITQGV